MKTFSIKGPSEEDINRFKELQVQLNETAAGTFKQILKQYGNPSTSSGDLDENLLATNQELTLQLEAATSRISELENTPPAVMETERKLTGTQFVFEPGPDQAKQMQRVIAYLKKNGKLSGIDQSKYLQTFTENAIRYFIKNEFNHVLK